ncbi:hypothetical protein V2J09_023344 [Rumex salicifolius]
MDGPKQKEASSSSSSSSAKSSIVELFAPKETPATASSLQPSVTKLASIFGSSPTEKGKGEQESFQPWNYYSSINYGGREEYHSPNSLYAKRENKKNVEDNDPSANWWQGSVYY